MKATEIINSVKELLHLSKEEVKVEDVIVDEVVELSTEEEVKEVILAEETKEEVIVEEVVEAPSAIYATSEELSAVKLELLSMIKALIEDKSAGDSKEVPIELSEEIKVELSEEIIHSPESVIETKKNLLSNPNKSMTTAQRVNRMLNN